MIRFKTAAMATIALAAVYSDAASADVVTSPVGIYTEPGTSNTGDPFAPNTWLRTNVRNGGQVGISSNYARSGNGSVYLQGSQTGGNSYKADIEYYFSDGYSRALSSLSSLSYDWYRDSSGTAASSHLHPSLRIFVDGDGSAGTPTDTGYLVFELANNPSPSPVPQDSWVSNDAFAGKLWSTGGLPTPFSTARTITDWLTLLPNAKVLGLSSGIGSGWDGAFEGAVDNISIGFGGAATTYNFEVAAVPLPAAALAGAVLMGGLGIGRKRRAATDA